jgi:hypothetical protein
VVSSDHELCSFCQVSRTDPLSKQVCGMCSEKLDLLQSFGTSCTKVEQELNNCLKTGNSGICKIMSIINYSKAVLS